MGVIILTIGLLGIVLVSLIQLILMAFLNDSPFAFTWIFKLQIGFLGLAFIGITQVLISILLH